MIFYIYLYTNLINNKKYVGQTNNFQRRVNEHKSCSFNPKSINYNDIVKLTQTSDETVRRVNIGAVDKDDALVYPLR